MDNIKDDNLKRLGAFIAEELMRLAKDSNDDDWIEINIKDHTIGELARCVTLQNLYLDRDEYEKCAIMKLRIQDIKSMLKMDDLDINLEDEE